MRRLLIIISDEAGEMLDAYKKQGNYGNLDTALDELIKSALGEK